MRYALLIVAVGATLFVTACAPSYYGQGRRLAREGDNAAAVPLFYREIEAHPASSRAWRELGIAFYEQDEMPRAVEALKQAAAIKPDARTHLYLGIVHEQQGDREQALRAYRVALGLEPGGKTRDLLESRTHVLVQEQVMAEVKAALNAEQELAPSDIPANTVAVVEFNSKELPPELAPLAKGLAEFTAQDLGKVGSLQVVDRLKIDAIREELKLSQSEFADPATAPRIGRLVGGRRIVTGTLLGLGDESFRLSGAVVNTNDQSVAMPEHADGALAEFFRVQKRFVFDVIEAMDITLTPEERTAIEEVPTENFLAFMAYSRGLAYRDRNQLQEAQAEFNSASALDAGFGQAAAQGRSITSILSGGAFGSAAQFGGMAAAESAVELGAAELGQFQTTLAGWNGFVPTDVDLFELGEFVDTPPRSPSQLKAIVIIRGNLDVRP